jgi:hypothetical protein
MKPHLSRKRNGWPTRYFNAGVGSVIALVLMVEIGFGAFGQTPPASEGHVRIDAIVTDRHGLPIQGLRMADFELRDRGVPLSAPGSRLSDEPAEPFRADLSDRHGSRRAAGGE